MAYDHVPLQVVPKIFFEVENVFMAVIVKQSPFSPAHADEFALSALAKRSGTVKGAERHAPRKLANVKV
jgi:hypothetical protein